MKEMELQHSEDAPSRLGGIHRRHARFRVNGFSGDIVDARRGIAGMIDNVSPIGFKLAGVKDEFTASRLTYRAVVQGNGKRYKLLVKPCWQKKTVGGMEVGFKILDAPWDWHEFVLQSAPDNARLVKRAGSA